MQRIAELVQQVVNMPGTSIENNGQVILAGTIPGTKPVQYRYEFFKPLTDEDQAAFYAVIDAKKQYWD